MKKPFKETKVGKLLKSKAGKTIGSFVTGALEVYLKPFAGVLVGAKEGIKQVKEDNLKSELGGYNKVNYPRLIGMVASLLLLIAYLFGYLDEEKLRFAVDFLSELNTITF